MTLMFLIFDGTNVFSFETWVLVEVQRSGHNAIKHLFPIWMSLFFAKGLLQVQFILKTSYSQGRTVHHCHQGWYQDQKALDMIGSFCSGHLLCSHSITIVP